MVDKLYHVATDWDGDDLLPLSHKYRAGSESEAIEQWLQRWPDGGAELAAYHVHYVHLYATREEAETHAEHFGGMILEIDPDQVGEIKMDDLEFDHPVAVSVPAAAITAI